MCKEISHRINPNFLFAAAILLGLAAGWVHSDFLFKVAETVSLLFINLLKLVSLPIVFLSILSTASGMESLDQVKQLGQKVVKYTLLTTILAATVALLLFISLDPVGERTPLLTPVSAAAEAATPSYLSFFVQIVPSNIIQPFSENNVIAVLFLAILLSTATLMLPEPQRKTLHSLFSSIYAALMVITRGIVKIMPIAIWAFVALFVRDLNGGELHITRLALYLCCVIGANLFQGGVILPLLLKCKGISPVALFRGMAPALSIGFFTKSSAAALPMAIRCAEENVGISSRTARFSLPLCTTINMNGCAAFILISVLFVSMSEGMHYSFPEMALWIILASIAAIGNAGVPMGCYFLTSAFLAAMNVPLHILGIILPFYALIDMIETALNVWSDGCVTAIVDKELTESSAASAPLPSLHEIKSS